MKWPAVCLLEAVAFDPPTPREKLRANDIPIAFMPMAEVSADSSRARTDQTRPSQEVLKGFTYFQSGDVLAAKITPCFENGKIALADIKHEHGFGSTEFHVLRAKPGRVHPVYLLHYLRQSWVRLEGERKVTGSAGQRRVPRHFLENLKIPLPPIEEQRRIAAILDQAETLRAKRREALAKLDTLTQSLFLEMFGRDREFGNLQTQTLGGLLDFLTSGSRGWAGHYQASGDLFLRIQNVQRDRLNLKDMAYVQAPASAEANRTRVQAGDVLLSITADLGRTAVIPEGLPTAYINQHLCILRSSSLVPRYLSAFLCSPSGRRQLLSKNREGVKAGLNFDDVRSLLIPVPSASAQKRFDCAAKRIDRQLNRQRACLVRTTALFHSLQHRAFRGEL